MVVATLMIRTVNGRLSLRLPYWHVNRAAATATEISSGPKRLDCGWMSPDVWTTLLRNERATLVFFLYKCFWKNNSNVNSTNFISFLKKIIKVLISQFYKRNLVGNFMNMVKNVLFLIAKFHNHVFVWSKYGANNVEGCFFFKTLFLKISLWMIMTSATL